jgi:membrane protease YdiL (CAAX protease family)
MAMPAPWRRGRDVFTGFGLGAAIILLVFGVEIALGWIRITGVKEGFGWATAVVVLVARFLHFSGVAVCEEAAYRGYLLQNVAERIPIWLAALLTGAVFAISHFAANGFSAGFIVSGIVATFLLSHMRLLTRAIWLGVGWHLGWDWLEDGLGLIPGYSPLAVERVGPPIWVGEGLAAESGLLFIVALATSLLLLTWTTRRCPNAPPWRSRLASDGTVQG